MAGSEPLFNTRWPSDWPTASPPFRDKIAVRISAYLVGDITLEEYLEWSFRWIRFSQLWYWNRRG